MTAKYTYKAGFASDPALRASQCSGVVQQFSQSRRRAPQACEDVPAAVLEILAKQGDEGANSRPQAPCRQVKNNKRSEYELRIAINEEIAGVARLLQLHIIIIMFSVTIIMMLDNLQRASAGGTSKPVTVVRRCANDSTGRAMPFLLRRLRTGSREGDVHAEVIEVVEIEIIMEAVEMTKVVEAIEIMEIAILVIVAAASALLLLLLMMMVVIVIIIIISIIIIIIIGIVVLIVIIILIIIITIVAVVVAIMILIMVVVAIIIVRMIIIMVIVMVV